VSYTVGKGVYIQVLETTNVKGTADLALYSNEFGQTVVGNAGANSLRGYGGNDTLSGGAGDDRISGGRGNDTLAGNSGADTYYFSYALNASTNVDTIKGFSSIDLISLSSAIFTKAGSVGALAASAFSANTTGLADDASDRIIWETDTGILRYDPDGTGSAEATAFAIITGNTGAINAGDFVIA
jgi:Ca2+-binding RTX toxin-like protein